MVIQYIGHSFFKITTSDLIIATDPFPKEIGLEPLRFKADILTISHSHWDHNNKKAILGDPFIIEEPGEYEVKGVSITGIRSFHDPEKGRLRGLNTIFLFKLGGIRLAHFGDFGQSDLFDFQKEALEGVDVIFIPVGGFYTIGPKEAAQIILELEPKIVIPMHFRVEGLKIEEIAPIDEFLKEVGAKDLSPIDKLTLKEKELKSNEKTEIVYLKPLALK